ncbi:MAG TPA: FAD-dependent oxidoreductase [Rhodopila sp.]
MTDRVSRRGFFLNAMAAGVAVGTLATPDAMAAMQWNREAAVVVVGADTKGITAAIAAPESGSSVIVLESQSHIGGHAIIGGGTSAEKEAWDQGIARSAVPRSDRLVRD